MSARWWSGELKWMGNLVPMIFWLPLTAAGVLIGLVKHNYLVGAYLVLAGQIIGWIAINNFGLWQNKALKRHLGKLFELRQGDFDGFRIFVGLSRPGFKSLLDPHEDIGYLAIDGSHLFFVGEHFGFRVQASEIENIAFASSIHTLLGLGGWVELDLTHDGERKILYFEPREERTLWRNNRLRKKLVGRLLNWQTARRLIA